MFSSCLPSLLLGGWNRSLGGAFGTGWTSAFTMVKCGDVGGKISSNVGKALTDAPSFFLCSAYRPSSIIFSALATVSSSSSLSSQLELLEQDSCMTFLVSFSGITFSLASLMGCLSSFTIFLFLLLSVFLLLSPLLERLRLGADLLLLL